MFFLPFLDICFQRFLAQSVWPEEYTDCITQCWLSVSQVVIFAICNKCWIESRNFSLFLILQRDHPKEKCFRYESIYLILNSICKSKKLATLIEGDLKAPFLITTTPRCSGGRYSISLIIGLVGRVLTNGLEDLDSTPDRVIRL